MNGLTEDLLNCISGWIVRNWKKRGGNLSYFVAQVKASGLTPAELDNFIHENEDTCPPCVNHVFAAIVYQAYINGEYSVNPNDKKGGKE